MAVQLYPLKAKKDSGKTPLVMLHGWGRSASDFTALGESLSQQRDVYLVDLPGFGKSDLLENTSTGATAGIEEYAKAIVSVLPIQSFYLFGHSVGGKISTAIAAEYPGKVNKLVLLDASGLPRVRTISEQCKIKCISSLRSLLKFLDKKFSLSLFESWFVPRFASADYKQAGPLKNSFVRIVNQSVASYLPKISCATLLIWGEKDTETPVDIGRGFEKGISGSQLIVLPGVGHNPHLEGSAGLLEYYTERFLNEG